CEGRLGGSRTHSQSEGRTAASGRTSPLKSEGGKVCNPAHRGHPTSSWLAWPPLVRDRQERPEHRHQTVDVGYYRGPMKSYSGEPMMLGTGVAARVRLIVWCKPCGHQVEPDPAEIAARYGADTPVLNWRDRLVCSACGRRQVDMVVTGTER